MVSIPDALRLEGLVIDDLTESCLRIATAPAEAELIHQRLGAFFRDTRNRLNRVKMSIYLLQRGGEDRAESIWEELNESYESLERLIDRVQGICRPTGFRPVESDLTLLLTERRPLWNDWFERVGCTLDWPDPKPAVSGLFDPVPLAEGLDALVGWRCTSPVDREAIRLDWWADGDELQVRWEESGDDPTSTLEGDAGEDISLALPMLARVMAAHAGRIEVAQREGLKILLRWPRDSRGVL